MSCRSNLRGRWFHCGKHGGHCVHAFLPHRVPSLHSAPRPTRPTLLAGLTAPQIPGTGQRHENVVTKATFVCPASMCRRSTGSPGALALNPSGAEGETQVLGSERSPRMGWKEDSGLGRRSLNCGRKTVPPSPSPSASESLPKRGTTSNRAIRSFQNFLFFFKIKLIIFITSSRIFSPALLGYNRHYNIVYRFKVYKLI